ncbi:hypothetical protein [Chromobacterium phragmitis]|uniref:hypothetical protein n=1 Tax=Chromobacterium phragmitis TaxID=2202141 RepID=UPI003263F427
MRHWLWWSLEFPLRSGGCLLEDWRCQQRFWRSTLFYGWRVARSGASWQAQWERIARRACADGIALCHDSAPARFRLWRRACRHLGPLDGAEWERCLRRSERAWLSGWVGVGRACSRL